MATFFIKIKIICNHTFKRVHIHIEWGYMNKNRLDGLR